MANDANNAWPSEPLAAAAHAAAARDADDGQGDNQGDNQGDDQGDDDQGDSGALNIAQMSDEMNAEIEDDQPSMLVMMSEILGIGPSTVALATVTALVLLSNQIFGLGWAGRLRVGTVDVKGSSSSSVPGSSRLGQRMVTSSGAPYTPGGDIVAPPATPISELAFDDPRIVPGSDLAKYLCNAGYKGNACP